jgi:PAS domain S-box-containing protein
MSDGFITFDREWRITYVNRAAEVYFGKSRDEMLGHDNWQLYPEAVGSEMHRRMLAAAAAREAVELEVQAPASLRWVAMRCYPSESGMAIYFRDVTAEKQARETLRESEERFRALFEHNLDGVLLTTPEGGILAANPALCRLLGRSEAELCRGGRALVVDFSDPRLAEFIAARASKGRAVGEMTLLHADGHKIPVEVSSAIFTAPDGSPRITMVVRDLTATRKAERALHLMAEATAVLTESLDHSVTVASLTRLMVPELADICVVDVAEGDRLQRVAVAERDRTDENLVAGIRHGQAHTTRPVGITHVFSTGQPEVVPEVTDAWMELAAENPEQLELARQVRPTSMLIVPIALHGKPRGVMSLGMRTSGRRFSADDIPLAQAIANRAGIAIEHARLYAEAVEGRRLRDEMLGIVSHDLKNPLNTIALANSLLARRAGGPETALIQRSFDRAYRLIQDLLTTALIDGGKMPLAVEETSLTAVLEEAVTLHRALAEERSLQLTASLPAGLPPVTIDRHRILQAASNLLGNALKFTARGGSVRVEAGTTDREVWFSVTDTGQGISREALSHVFDRFWRDPTTREPGVGLGLAIVKGIADAHGARIDVASEVGQGSTFTVHLPRVAAPRT